MDVKKMFSLEGKVALITGGAGLYGRQLVDGLAEAGATTIVASRSKAALDALAEEHRQIGQDVHAMTYDQGDPDSITALRDAILEQFGRCDILVNNSVLRPMGKGGDPVEEFDRSMKVNATGLFAITKAFGDAMADRKSGAIVNIGSMQGMIAPDPCLYEGTTITGWSPDYFFHKSGMINFTRYMASYYGQFGVRCNCVAPGGYQTDSHDPQFLENYAKKTMLGRMANDDDLKGVVVFLASDAASYVTGATLPVDAGYTAK